MNLPVPILRSPPFYNTSLFLIFPHSHSSTASSSSSSSSPFAIGVTRTIFPKLHVVSGGVRFDEALPLNDDDEVTFEHCVTRTLPPALTLEDGLQKLKDALEILKIAPPSCETGFLRFQVSQSLTIVLSSSSL